MVTAVRQRIERCPFPRLATMTLCGCFGVVVAAISLVVAVPLGLSVSVTGGVALTWIAVFLGTASVIGVIVGVTGTILGWTYGRVKRGQEGSD